jgi:hypothetical protein
MMGTKQKLDWEACDMILFRGKYPYLLRGGVKKKIKRRLHKRLRQEWKFKLLQ